MYDARSLGLTVTKSSGGEELVLCPFHADSHPSAWYSSKRGLFYCAVCNLGLNTTQLMQQLGLEPVDVEFMREENLPDFDLLGSVNLTATGESFYHPYFYKRGVSEKIALEFGLRWQKIAPQAAILPITNYFGDIEGLCYRYLDVQESGTRYRFAGELTPIWPMHHLSRMESDTVIVFEGAFSVMRVATFLDRYHTVANLFALMGAKANEKIVQTLRPFKAIVLYDNDFAGQRACRKLRQLNPLIQSWTLNKSPDDMDDDEIDKLFTKLLRKVEP